MVTGQSDDGFETDDLKRFGGRFAHLAVAAFGNTVLVAGGYRGNMLDDLIAFMVPLAIAKNEVCLNSLDGAVRCTKDLFKIISQSLGEPKCRKSKNYLKRALAVVDSST